MASVGRYRTSCGVVWFGVLILIWMAGFGAVEGLAQDRRSEPAAGQSSHQKQNPTPVIGAMDIQIVDAPPGKADYFRDVAQDLIFLRKGRQFSEKGFAESIQALQKSTLFKTIDVPDPDWSETPITLTFRLTPFRRIQDIRIDGAFPVLQSEVRSVMTVSTGMPYVPDDLPRQVPPIKKLFIEKGFNDPGISIDGELDPATGNYVLKVDIDTGWYYRIDNVSIDGNRRISGFWLKPRLDTWQSSLLCCGASRLVEQKVRKDKETLLTYYRKKHFAEAAIGSKVDRRPESETASIVFNVEEGPRYKIEISGYDAFWGWTLKKDVVVFKRGNRSGLGLRKTVRNMENRYEAAGFLDAQVNMQDEIVQEEDGPVRQVRIDITEGPQYIVDAVTISGHPSFSREKLRKQMITGPPGLLADGAYVPKVLDEDIEAIKTLYRRNGFLETQIDKKIETRKSPGDENITAVNIGLSITEGPQTLVTGVSVTGGDGLDHSWVRNLVALSPGTPYYPDLMENARIDLANRISERGYPHVKVAAKVENSGDRTGAHIVYHVAEGPYVEMGRTFFSGNFKTTRKTLARRMTLKPGQPFSLKKLLESQKNIRSINALDAASFETFGLEEKADRVNMLAEIHEKKPYYTEFTVGYDTWRHLYLGTTVGTINFLGTNKELWAGAQWSQIGYLLQTGINEPNLFNTGISANAVFYVEKREELNHDFGVRTYGGAVGFTRGLLKDLTGSLNVGYETREVYLIDGEPASQATSERYDPRSVIVITPGVVYNTTDSFLRPTRGTLTSLKVDISNGLTNSLDDFFKYRFDTRYYYSPFDTITLAWRGFYGRIDPYGGTREVPDDQLFFLGGANNVRGFAENKLLTNEAGAPVGGLISMVGSMEIRFELGMNFEFVTFYDGGAVQEPLLYNGPDAWRSSAGVGLRYHTAIGPIGLMYGWKLDRREGESPGALHFAIGYSF